MAGIGRAARCPRLLALARARLLTGLTRLGISAVVAIVAAAALLVACGGAASADEVRFQNVSDPGPEPFTAPALAQDPPQPTPPPQPAPPQPAPTPPPPTPEQPAPPGPTEPDPATEDKQEAPGAPTEEEKGRYERYCKMKDAEPSHSDKKFCEEYRKKYLQGQGAEEDEQNQPAGEKSDEPDSGPLAFTGLDIWQLVLLALVLVGGGLGARRLLAN